jgi:hypothetical protein
LVGNDRSRPRRWHTILFWEDALEHPSITFPILGVLLELFD